MITLITTTDLHTIILNFSSFFFFSFPTSLRLLPSLRSSHHTFPFSHPSLHYSHSHCNTPLLSLFFLFFSPSPSLPPLLSLILSLSPPFPPSPPPHTMRVSVWCVPPLCGWPTPTTPSTTYLPTVERERERRMRNALSGANELCCEGRKVNNTRRGRENGEEERNTHGRRMKEN